MVSGAPVSALGLSDGAAIKVVGRRRVTALDAMPRDVGKAVAMDDVAGRYCGVRRRR